MPSKITTLVENTAKGRGILGEHGLSILIQRKEYRALFDTGQTAQVLMHNAKQLDIDLSQLDAIVLSHGHFDHTGGLDALLQVTGRTKLFMHPDALTERFTRHSDGSMVSVGIPKHLTREYLGERAEIVWTESPTEVVPGLHVTGRIPRITDFEDTGGDFYLDEHGQQRDPITDDQAAYFDSPDGSGTVVILGCGHAGVVNTLSYIQHQTGNSPIHAVIGGMHLLRATRDRMDKTIRALTDMDIKIMAPTHCTGPEASAELWYAFGHRWRPCPVTTWFEF